MNSLQCDGIKLLMMQYDRLNGCYSCLKMVLYTYAASRKYSCCTTFFTVAQELFNAVRLNLDTLSTIYMRNVVFVGLLDKTMNNLQTLGKQGIKEYSYQFIFHYDIRSITV